MLSGVNAWVRKSRSRRIAAIVLCAWVVAVVGAACHSVLNDQVEIYRSLGLWLVGVPFALLATGFALSLIGRRALLAMGVLLGIGVTTLGIVAGIRRHQQQELEAALDARREALAQVAKGQRKECETEFPPNTRGKYTIALCIANKRGLNRTEADYVASPSLAWADSGEIVWDDELKAD